MLNLVKLILVLLHFFGIGREVRNIFIWFLRIIGLDLGFLPLIELVHQLLILQSLLIFQSVRYVRLPLLQFFVVKTVIWCLPGLYAVAITAPETLSAPPLLRALFRYLHIAHWVTQTVAGCIRSPQAAVQNPSTIKQALAHASLNDLLHLPSLWPPLDFLWHFVTATWHSPIG